MKNNVQLKSLLGIIGINVALIDCVNGYVR